MLPIELKDVFDGNFIENLFSRNRNAGDDVCDVPLNCYNSKQFWKVLRKTLLLRLAFASVVKYEGAFDMN